MIRAEPAETKPKTRGIMDDAPRLGNVYGFTLEQLTVRPGWNSRESDFSADDPEDIWLAESIRDSGVLEPLTIVKEGDKVFITNGHRRYAAATYARDVLGAKIERLPCRLAPRGSSPLDLLFHQQDLNGSKGYSSFEKGTLCKKALALGATMDEVAARMHMSRTYVVSLLDFQAAPKAIVDLVKDDAVAPTLAMQVMREAKGDTAAATEKLVSAVTKARAAGKTRATAKHVDRPKVEIVSSPTGHPAYAAGLRRAAEILRAHFNEPGCDMVLASAIGWIEAEIGG